MNELLAAIETTVADRFSPGEMPALTRRRHREALEECHAALVRAAAASSAELKAEDLRLAARALGRITGRVDVEDILDRIFRDFCIGK
jgi:tRNA modification GTPase